MHTHTYTAQEKYLLNKDRTLVADGIHQVHFTIGGNSSGFAGNRRKEINCSNLSTNCLNLLCVILKQTCCSYSHATTVYKRVYIISITLNKKKKLLFYTKSTFQIYILKKHALEKSFSNKTRSNTESILVLGF